MGVLAQYHQTEHHPHPIRLIHLHDHSPPCQRGHLATEGSAPKRASGIGMLLGQWGD